MTPALADVMAATKCVTIWPACCLAALASDQHALEDACVASWAGTYVLEHVNVCVWLASVLPLSSFLISGSICSYPGRWCPRQ